MCFNCRAGTKSFINIKFCYSKQIPEELTLDYAEITSIPPLPLWTLLAADKENISQQQKEEVKVSKIPFKLSLN